MAEPDSSNKPYLLSPQLKSEIKPNPSKSYSAFLCKSLFFAFLLVVIPLFPSQAPEFINQTILSKFWELLHLLFIGIAVSYGLFSRKKSETENDIEIQPKLDSPKAYLSGILHFSSIFEDECENPYGSDEKRQIQVWDSQYFQGESMVFVSPENCVVEDLGKPRSMIDHKPLGLPVRSLKSVKKSGPSSDSKVYCENSEKLKNGKFRGLVPINLEEKFKETVPIPSPVPWRSRSSRMEVREDVNSTSTSHSHSHSKHLSIGEFEFDYLKSESFWSPIFSQNSCMPSKTENVEREKSICRSASKSRNVSSIGSFSDMNCDSNSKDFSMSTSMSRREVPLGRGNLGVDCWKTEVKGKSLQRGKSVRTIRASEKNVFEGKKMGEICSDHVENNEGKTSCEKFDDFSLKESSKLPKLQDGEMQDSDEINGVEDEKDSESEFEKFQVSSGEEQEQEQEFDEEFDNDEAFDAFEVDKKASEFIAKFREQIRLQKIASNTGFSGW